MTLIKRARCARVVVVVTVVVAIFSLVSGLLFATARRTAPRRAAMASFVALVQAANQQNLDAARSLCSRRYLAGHPLSEAKEGGLVGFPRNIQKNFQVWSQGDAIWICPTNRIGPIYQFLKEDGTWKFDGPIGVLRPRGQILLTPQDGD